MNCEDFNNIVNELAESRPMQASIRDAGVSHVALCPGCAEKLADAKAVSGLLVRAAGAESERAPGRIKESLLAAFERRQSELISARSLKESVVNISSRRPRWWTAAAVAAAAMILLAVIVPIWRRVSTPNPQVARAESHAGTPGPAVTPNEPLTPSAEEGPLSEKPRATEKKNFSRPELSTQRATESARVNQANVIAAPSTDDFMPLTYLSTSTAMESGTVVRVELSRSALASLGFPVSVDGAGTSVKADVVLGDDGVARAIRLVQ